MDFFASCLTDEWKSVRFCQAHHRDKLSGKWNNSFRLLSIFRFFAPFEPGVNTQSNRDIDSGQRFDRIAPHDKNSFSDNILPAEMQLLPATASGLKTDPNKLFCNNFRLQQKLLFENCRRLFSLTNSRCRTNVKWLQK